MKRGKERRLGKDGPVKTKETLAFQAVPHAPQSFPRVVSALLAFLVAFGLFWFLIHRPGLHIGKIRIIGATYVTREEVLEEGGLWEPINVLDIDRKQLIQNLEKDVRIEKRAFPLPFLRILISISRNGCPACTWNVMVRSLLRFPIQDTSLPSIAASLTRQHRY